MELSPKNDFEKPIPFLLLSVNRPSAARFDLPMQSKAGCGGLPAATGYGNPGEPWDRSWRDHACAAGERREAASTHISVITRARTAGSCEGMRVQSVNW